jgi:phosphoglycerate dehydrogenase-like enzyme
MPISPLKIWCNAELDDAAFQRLRAATSHHQLVVHEKLTANAWEEGEPSADLLDADIAFGQPNRVACQQSTQLRWLAINSGGYTTYDWPEFREGLRERGAVFTNMSSVFADACAQHVLGMMLALNRKLPDAWADQQKPSPTWASRERRMHSQVLNGQTVLILSFGTVARRLVEILQPFGVKIYALRRRAYSEPGVFVIAEERLSAVLPTVDHLVNILPQNASTDYYVNARRLALLKRGACFYNVGRGTTVDHAALTEALCDGRLGAAYLDVTEPEPLPPEHALWRTPHCYITPHTAGGRVGQTAAVVDHFIANLARFEAGDFEGMTDRID